MPSRRATIRAAIFDLDDTLFPERQYVWSGYGAVAEHLLRERRQCGQSVTSNLAVSLQEWLWGRFLAGCASGSFDAMNEHFALGLTGQQIAESVAVYRNHVPRIEPFGGMADFLGRLRGRMAVGLLSDGFLPAQRLKLQALQLERFFDVVVLTEELSSQSREFWKPSTRGFELISSRLGVAPEACAYVGDNPAKDFVAANKLGWLSAQFIRSGQVHAANVAPAGGEPSVVVRDLDSLYRLLIA